MGNNPESSIGSVPRSLELKFSGSGACHSRCSQAIKPVTAMAFSMIVETTSLTPRVVLSTPAIPAYSEPVIIATTMMTKMCNTAGRLINPPTWAAIRKAMRYWPSTPMLNRFIRKPIAAAVADR